MAERLARDLQDNGIHVQIDLWDVRSGVNIPGFMNDALSTMTHFLLLASGADAERPWVKLEWTSALVQKMAGKAEFIVARHGIAFGDLPPLLQPMYTPSLDDYDAGMKELVSDIHGLVKRPPLGPLPPTMRAARPGTPTGLSIAAEGIVRLFVERSPTGSSSSSALPVQVIRDDTGLTDPDIIDAVDELENLDTVRKRDGMGSGPIGFFELVPTDELFADFDGYFRPWDPAEDGKTIAIQMMAAPSDYFWPQKEDEKLGWGPRRLNPALAWLVANGHVEKSNENAGQHPYRHLYVIRTSATRRFVKNLGT